MGDDLAAAIADALASALDGSGGWYCNFSTADEAWVVFRGRVFHYPRGDAGGRAEAQAYGRSIGLPEAQLDWGESEAGGGRCVDRNVTHLAGRKAVCAAWHRMSA